MSVEIKNPEEVLEEAVEKEKAAQAEADERERRAIALADAESFIDGQGLIARAIIRLCEERGSTGADEVLKYVAGDALERDADAAMVARRVYFEALFTAPTGDIVEWYLDYFRKLGPALAQAGVQM